MNRGGLDYVEWPPWPWPLIFYPMTLLIYNPTNSPPCLQAIVPPHASNQVSILQPIYKHLPPEDVVQLKAGDKLIVVVLAMGPKTPNDVACILCSYTRVFKNVLDRTLWCLHPGDRTSVVDDAIRNDHTFLQEDHPFLEFACCVPNYPERKHFEQGVMEIRDIEMFWQQGAGINLSICGCWTQQSVLLELRHVAYLKMFLKTLLDAFISERIRFNNNVQDTTKLVDPFLEQLLLFDGCRFGTVEVLWKYYRTVTTSKQREWARQQLKAATMPEPLPNNDNFAEKPEYILLLFCLELIDE